MLDALKDYVKMIAEVKELKVTDRRIEDVAYAVQNDEEIWDLIDSRIDYLLLED